MASDAAHGILKDPSMQPGGIPDVGAAKAGGEAAARALTSGVRANPEELASIARSSASLHQRTGGTATPAQHAAANNAALQAHRRSAGQNHTEAQRLANVSTAARVASDSARMNADPVLAQRAGVTAGNAAAGAVSVGESRGATAADVLAASGAAADAALAAFDSVDPAFRPDVVHAAAGRSAATASFEGRNAAAAGNEAAEERATAPSTMPAADADLAADNAGARIP